MPRLEFTIAVKPFGDAARKDAKKVTDELRTQGKEVDKDTKKLKQFAGAWGDIGKQIEKTKKRQAELFDITKSKATELGQKLRELHRHSSAAFELGMFRGINKVQGGFEGVIRKVFTLKNALLATAVGGAGYLLGRKAIGNAFGDIETESTVKRRFGGDSGQLFSLADRIAGRAGVEGGTAQAGLIELAEAIQGTATEGTAFHGKKLTGASSAALRKKLLEFAGSRYERLLTLFPNQDPAQIAELLAQVGTGAEGTRTFARAFGINKVLAGRIEKEAEKKKLGRGDVLDRLLESSGLTEEAAAAKRKTFQFQIKSIGSQLEDSLGGIGRKAVESLNKKFGEGTTLAQKLQDFLASDRGKNAIDQMGQSLAKVVGFAAELASKIPEALGWLERNKTLLITLGSIYGGARVIGAGRDLVEGVFGKNLGLFGNLVGGGGIPVKVTNWTGAGDGFTSAIKLLLSKNVLAGGAAAAVFLHSPELNAGEGAYVRSQAFKDEVKAMDEKARAYRYAQQDKDVVFGPGNAPGVKAFLSRREEESSTVFGPGDSRGVREFMARTEAGQSANITLVNNTYLDSKLITSTVEKRQINQARDQAPPR